MYTPFAAPVVNLSGVVPRRFLMGILLTTIHVLVCLFLIVVVLLQSGKAADLAGAFGGMGSQTVFGPRGSATVLSRATTIAAGLFMITSMTLSIMATRQGTVAPSILDKIAKPAATQTAPAAGQPVPAPGGTAPITVTPEVGGQKQAPQTINVPVLPPGQMQKQPQQKK
jgi:preprotein translocase subunit SecG